MKYRAVRLQPQRRSLADGQAFFERLAPSDVRAESAGTQPTRAIWPEVIQAMREVNIDLSDRKPKKLTPEMELHADWAVTMRCGDSCPYVPTTVEEWDISDPAGLPLEEVREIREVVEEHVQALIDEKLEEIRTDPTAHHVRLAQLLPELAREFEGSRTPEKISACADAILHRFGNATVRSHIITLALRQTRECLRQARCDALANS